MSQTKLLFVISTIFLLISACSQAEEPPASSEPEGINESEVVVEIDEPEVVSNEAEQAPIQLASAYAIVPGESMARFELDEDLRSADTGWGQWTRVTVVGDTDQVFGTIEIDPENLADIQFQDIYVDANSFYTVEFVRKRKIQTEILQSEVYPLITFEGTEVRNMPEQVDVGDTVEFNLDGMLTIREISLPQTFDVTATLNSADEIVGTASTVVTRESYELKIPGVPNIADVEDEVELYIDFVAKAQAAE